MNDTPPGMTATVPEDRLKLYASLLGRARVLEKAAESKDDFLSFVRETWPDFIQGRHHKIMAEKFTALAEGVDDGPKPELEDYADYPYSRACLPFWKKSAELDEYRGLYVYFSEREVTSG